MLKTLYYFVTFMYRKFISRINENVRGTLDTRVKDVLILKNLKEERKDVNLQEFFEIMEFNLSKMYILMPTTIY